MGHLENFSSTVSLNCMGTVRNKAKRDSCSELPKEPLEEG